ncbi:Cytochrome c oxidase subunit 4 [Coemansia sp. RSA 1200]|nr:Cytochrome c oxidase subunit 4 [Coemansia sp. RSA 1200]
MLLNAVRRSVIVSGAGAGRALSASRGGRATVAAVREFHAASVRLSDSHEKAPMKLGPGAAKDSIPTNFEQSTGEERAEHLAAMEGKEYFDLNPLTLEKKGTMSDPTIVPSGAASRIVGCNGAPGEDHELLWMVIERARGVTRCPQCGNAFKLSDEGFDPNNLPPVTHGDYHGF